MNIENLIQYIFLIEIIFMIIEIILLIIYAKSSRQQIWKIFYISSIYLVALSGISTIMINKIDGLKNNMSASLIIIISFIIYLAILLTGILIRFYKMNCKK